MFLEAEKNVHSLLDQTLVDQTLVRFAPSPTGLLHPGNLRTAIINYLFAKKNNGKFILRLDDTDQERSEPKFASAIEKHLQECYVNYDFSFKQSDRLHRYQQVFELGVQNNFIYACFESEEDLKKQRLIQRKQRKTPVYNRASLKLSQQEIQTKIDQGLKPYYRFLLSDEVISFQDGCLGNVSIDLTVQSDPVIRRSNGQWLYSFCSVVDDIDCSISHIIRGNDHVTNTAVQASMFGRLGHKLPKTYHHNLIKLEGDEKFSKRQGGLSIAKLLNSGYDAMAIVSLSLLTGSPYSIYYEPNMQNLVQLCELERYSKSASYFNLTTLDKLNKEAIQNSNFTDYQKNIDEIFKNDFQIQQWQNILDSRRFDILKFNVVTIKSMVDWALVLSKPLEVRQVRNIDYFNKENKQACLLLFESALLGLAELEKNNDAKNWLEGIKKASGFKGKALFLPLRLVLCARNNGPDMVGLINCSNTDNIRANMQNAVEYLVQL